MKVLITGGNGFIGRHLVAQMRADGHDTTVLTRFDRPALPGVNVIRGDLTATDCALDAFVDGGDVLFHCAGETRDESAMKALHVDGTERLLEAVRRSGDGTGRIMHWVQLSSVGAYGPSLKSDIERVVTEESPTRPANEYERTKTISDDLVGEAAATGVLTCTIIRPSAVIGPDMPNDSLRRLGKLVKRRAFFYIGKHGAVANYVHVDDVVEALRRASTCEAARGQTFNVSNDCTIEELVGGIAAALKVPSPRLRIPEPLARAVARASAFVRGNPLTQERINVLVRRTSYPTTKIAKYLNLTPRIPVPVAVGEVVAP